MPGMVTANGLYFSGSIQDLLHWLRDYNTQAVSVHQLITKYKNQEHRYVFIPQE